jgi:hypothetical protein
MVAAMEASETLRNPLSSMALNRPFRRFIVFIYQFSGVLVLSSA